MRKSRIVLLFLAFLSAWCLMIFKAAHLQVLPNQKLTDLKKRQFKKRINLATRRGAILDREGKELAVSIPSYSLFVDPSLVKSPNQLASQLSKILHMPRQKLLKKINNKPRRFIWLKRHLSKDIKEKIVSLKNRSLGFIEEPKRIYPNNSLLSQVLGFVGSGGKGLEGLELYRDAELRGVNKKIQIKKDARGRPLLIDGHVLTSMPDGSEITLTIDSEIQYVLERELQEAMELHEARSAVGIVVDAETSEILAMANVPTFNLNSPVAFDRKLWRNRVVTDAFEPGSTFKSLVVAAALKADVVKPNSRFYCEDGRFQVGRRIIGEADSNHHFKWLTVSEILTHSSNIGTTKIAFKLGAEKLRKSLLEFGIGNETQVKLPGEAKGLMHALPWQQHLLSNISFGHGITVTPLQMAMAYNVIANGGALYKPLLIKSVAGEEVKTYEAKKVRQVLTNEQASLMRLMLTASAANRSKIKGFQVAGKTGTAQRIREDGRGYEKGKYIASYAGFVPAHKPKFVIYVAVDSPMKKYYGAEVAAPIFSKVAQYAVTKYRLAPTLLNTASIVNQNHSNNKKIKALRKITSQVLAEELSKNKVPPLKGLTLREVIRHLKASDVQLKIDGRGVVYNTIPHEGAELPKSRKLKVELRPVK